LLNWLVVGTGECQLNIIRKN